MYLSRRAVPAPRHLPRPARRSRRPSDCASCRSAGYTRPRPPLFFLVLAEHQIADELLAPELAELHVRLDAPVERHADRPRTRVDVRILDRRLIRQVIG